MRPGPGILAVAVLLALAGCVPSAPTRTPVPSASATPLFASDEEALAAAEAAYAAYLKVSASITSDGGVDPSRIDALVTRKQAVVEHATYAYLSERNLRTQGEPSFSSPTLQQVSYNKAGTASIVFYTCVDATSVKVVDLNGNDVTPATRPARTPLEVSMQSSPAAELLISGSDTWSGPGVC